MNPCLRHECGSGFTAPSQTSSSFCRHIIAFGAAISGCPCGGCAGGRRPTWRRLSYAENTALAGDATREAIAREPPSSTRLGRSPAIPVLPTQQRNAAQRGARGLSNRRGSAGEPRVAFRTLPATPGQPRSGTIPPPTGGGPAFYGHRVLASQHDASSGILSA